MKKYLRIIQSKVFLRLLAIFIAMLALLYALGLTLIWQINARMQGDADAVHSQMTVVLDGIESELSQLLGMVQDHIIYNRSLMLAVNYKYLTPYRRMMDIQALQDILAFTKNRSTYIKDIKCNIYSAERAIGMTGQISGIDYEVIEDMRRIQSEGTGSLLFYRDELHLFIQYPTASVNPQSVLFSVDILLDTQKIHANIAGFLSEAAKYRLVFNTSRGSLAISGDLAERLRGQTGESRIIEDASNSGLLSITVLLPNGNGHLDMMLPMVMIIATVVIVLIAFMYSRWMMQAVDVHVEQENLARIARIQQLEMQINPHFLYNSFNLLSSILHQEDIETAIEYTSLLGKYYRYITRNDGQEVALSHEIEHARVFAEIQSRRYDGRIRVELSEPPPMLMDIPVPRMIIQPILENAFEHGVGGREGGGVVRMTYALTGSCLLVAVEDNGPGLGPDQMAMQLKSMLEPRPGATGIVNIGRRLILKYGIDYAPEFGRSDLGGLRVTIRIPLDGAPGGNPCIV